MNKLDKLLDNLIPLILIVGALLMAMNNIANWGWFLFLAFIIILINE